MCLRCLGDVASIPGPSLKAPADQHKEEIVHEFQAAQLNECLMDAARLN